MHTDNYASKKQISVSEGRWKEATSERCWDLRWSTLSYRPLSYRPHCSTLSYRSTLSSTLSYRPLSYRSTLSYRPRRSTLLLSRETLEGITGKQIFMSYNGFHFKLMCSQFVYWDGEVPLAWRRIWTIAKRFSLLFYTIPSPRYCYRKSSHCHPQSYNFI